MCAALSFRPEGCQRQAGAETRSKAESPEGKSIGIPIFPSEFLFFSIFFPLFFLALQAMTSIIEHSRHDSSEAATRVVCAFLIYAERLAILYGNLINNVQRGGKNVADWLHT